METVIEVGALGILIREAVLTNDCQREARSSVSRARAETSRPLASFAASEALGLVACVLDVTDEIKRLLRHVIALAVENFLEAGNGLLTRHVLAGQVGEHFGDEESLAQKAL